MRTSRTALPATIVASLALAALTTIAYVPALRAGFVWDDDHYVTANETLRSADGLRRIWAEPGAVAQYYPLTFTSLWLEYRLWGVAPAGYHATNVALHAANAVLVWRLLLALEAPAAWGAAALFAVHPIHVESVAWITERKNVLSGACYLAALLALAAWAGITRRPTGRRRDLALGVALFVAALLSKTVTASLPVVLCVLAWWRTGRVPPRLIYAMVPLVVLGAAFGFMTAAVEREHVGAVGTAWSQTFAERLLIAGRALWFYAAKLVWPFPLAFVYPRWTLDTGSLAQWAFPAMAAGAAVAAWALRARVGRAAPASMAIFAVTLVPALGFANVYPMRYSFVADHFAYLASIPVLALLAGGVMALRIPARMLAAGGALVLVALAALTTSHARAFTDARTLWEDTLAKNPHATIAYVDLGLLAYHEGRDAEALGLFDRGLALEPEAPDVWNDRALVLGRLGRTNEALAAYGRALDADPDHAESRNNYGNALAALGRYAEARVQFERAVASHPRYAEAHNNLANVLALGGDLRGAIGHYEAAIAVDPRYADAHRNLGEVALALGDASGACRHFEAAARLRPADGVARVGLGRCMALGGRASDGAAELRAQLARAPDDVGAALALAWILATARDASVRRPGEAVALAEAVAAAIPADPRALDTLAATYAAAGRNADAVRAAERAVAAAREGAPGSAAAIERRLARYREGEAWYEP